jgi:hypothetical protein
MKMQATETITNNGTQDMTDGTAFWSKNIDAAFTEARANGKYVLIAFGAEYRPTWKMAVALAFMNEAAIDLSRKFQCVLVDETWPHGDRTAAIYGVTKFPTVVICNAQGKVIYRISSLLGLEELIPELSTTVLEIVASRHVAPVAKIACVKVQRRPATRPLALRTWIGALAHAIIG